MAQLTYTDPLRQRKRVHYTGSDTLKEGEPLCYSFKTTRNWYGYSDSANAIGDTTAEGSHNEGKYIYVESPLQVSTATAAVWTQATKLITGAGDEFDNLQVGMFVSVASVADDTSIDGIYEITAVDASADTITLGNMTDAKAATVDDAIDDVTVKIDNISAFAGVVAAGSWVGKAGPCELDIYIPNGAIVPVRNDQNCVLGRTILAINSNEQHLTAPLGGTSRPVAIAWETVDTATTNGLVLAKLDPNIFLHQHADNNSLLVDDQDTGWQRVNTISLECAGSQWLEGLYVSMDFLAAHTGSGVALNVDMNLYGTATVGQASAIQGSVYFQSGFVATDGEFRALSGKVKDEATVDLTGSNVACLYLEHMIRAASTGPASSSMIRMNATAGTNAPDYLFFAQNAAALAYTGDGAHSEGATKLGDIKIYISGTPGCAPGYIRVYDGTS